MGFQPRRLIRNQRVTGRVRLVETITGKLLHQVKNIGSGPGFNLVGERTLGKYGALLLHFLGFLLAHRAAQHVGSTERVTGQHLGNLHDLLLVENDTVGRSQYRLQGRVGILDAGTAVLAIDEIVDHARLQRARSKQRHQRNNILEAVGLQAPDQVFHAARFELKYRRGLVCL